MLSPFCILVPIYVSLTPEVESKMRTPLHSFDFAESNSKLPNFESKKEKKSKNPLKVFANLRQTLRRSKQDLSNAKECYSPGSSMTPTPDSSKKRPFSFPANSFTGSMTDIAATEDKPKKKLTRAATFNNKYSTILRRIKDKPDVVDKSCDNKLCKKQKEKLVDTLVYERLQIADEVTLPEIEFETVQEFSPDDYFKNEQNDAEIDTDKNAQMIIDNVIAHLSAFLELLEQRSDRKPLDALGINFNSQQVNVEKLLADLKMKKHGMNESAKKHKMKELSSTTIDQFFIKGMDLQKSNNSNQSFSNAKVETKLCCDTEKIPNRSKTHEQSRRCFAQKVLYKPLDNLNPSYIADDEKVLGHSRRPRLSTAL